MILVEESSGIVIGKGTKTKWFELGEVLTGA
jgi:hypothetical protein